MQYYRLASIGISPKPVAWGERLFANPGIGDARLKPVAINDILLFQLVAQGSANHAQPRLRDVGS